MTSRPAAPAATTRSLEATPAATARGILTVLVAWFLLSSMDAGSKLLAQDYPIVQILWVRYLFLVAVAWVFARRQASRTPLRSRRLGLQVLRALILVVEIGLFIFGITVLSLASAHAILAITPLIVTALSVPILGERVGIRRWAAIAVAFTGVLIILRPGLGVMQPMAIVILVCAGMFALYQVLTRLVSRDDSATVTLFYTALIGAIALSVIGPFFWIWPDVRGWALFLLVALLGAGAHFLLIKALQLAPAAALQPYSYSLIVFATLVGFVVFGNLPDLWTIAGAAIIAASGLYAFARERKLAAQA